MFKKLISLLMVMLLVCAVLGTASMALAADAAPDADPNDTTTIGTIEEPAEADDASGEAEEEAHIEFVLFEKLKKVDTKGWIMFGSALVLTVALIVFLATRKKEAELSAGTAKVSTTLILCQGALCVAMSFVLSYIKLFSMPAGGSVTLASMLPLMVFANRHGVKWGLFAGLVYGLLQFIQKPEIYHWVDVILEYPVAFSLIGLGGLTRGVRNLPFSVLIGGIARFFAHFVAGVVFFGEYVMIGKDAAAGVSFGQMLWPNVVVSFLYNAPYMFADIAICFLIALLPPFRNAIRKALKY